MKLTMFCEMSIDGKLTLSKGISSKTIFPLLTIDDIKFIHKFRGSVQGLMVGKNTVNIDNPSLTNRYEENKNPIRIIPTRTLNIAKDSTVLKDENKTVFLTTDQNKNKAKFISRHNNKFVICSGTDEIDFEKAFDILEQEYNVKHIMLEGGGELNWSMIEKGFVDDIILLIMPVIIGGRDNTTLVDGDGFSAMRKIKKFKLYTFESRENLLILRYKARKAKKKSHN